MPKTLGIVISTPGRRSLAHTLQSIHYQRTGVEDVLVVGDGYHKLTQGLCETFAEMGLPVRYQATTKTRDWGHSQVNYGFQNVRGDYVTYQDDDDIYMPRAIEEMIRLATPLDPPRPMIGRIKSPHLGLLWPMPGPQAVLDGHCIVTPNDKKKIGWMTGDYTGDQSYIHHTLRSYTEWAWVDRVWTLARPKGMLICTRMTKPRDDYWVFHFARREGDLWAMEDCCALALWREDPEHHYMVARLLHSLDTTLTLAEVSEVVEFAKWAGQGHDCWFRIDDPDDPDMIGALRNGGFVEHTTTEYTHDWPPEAPGTFDAILDPNDGERIMDWRDDVWGGRSTVS